MLYFKSCPKCATGTIEHNYDTHGEFAQCLNCGFMRDTPGAVSERKFKQLLGNWRNELLAHEQSLSEAVA